MNPLYQAQTSPMERIAGPYQSFGMGQKFRAGRAEAQIQQCAIADLTHLSRVGFRGIDSAAYLIQAGYQLPDRPNMLLKQNDGTTVARLSATEYLLLGAWSDFGESIAQLEQNWSMNEQANYMLPRQDSHAWIQLTGSSIALVMAKLCAVDLSAEAFTVGQIAQTSVARINAIVMNVSDAQAPKFNILCDRAASLYLWHVLLDAIAEFDGQAVGIESLIAV
ncbi:sarcosine oxidase subunit gamma [Acinetobacter sp. YH12063]|uniref:sarcosine oxidase subunit gamma n=1 Tax=Acinetobacter sp. YH12063 TaxID=2601061 RepID=UPI0015D3BD57|nr:sarcosine oxidase [Acinetobacter sp. YH12063]